MTYKCTRCTRLYHSAYAAISCTCTTRPLGQTSITDDLLSMGTAPSTYNADADTTPDTTFTGFDGGDSGGGGGGGSW
jgi:uncharacterized membrane protein YgcG